MSEDFPGDRLARRYDRALLRRRWDEGDPVWRAHILHLADHPGPAIDPPGPLARAVNFAGAVVAHAVAGFPAASEETAAGRLAICRACPDLDRANMSCRRCGCQLDIKVYWADQRCPAGKW